ncbi:hypothetical protein LTR08_007996 [Meristemomyces frigidus]|nr:hypothetical protein LTR08_007996 [Meristemomyces frigidus]
MKMTPRPSSPTSLLWAHQLKREHGFLLGRMQQLESSNQQQDDRLKNTETVAKTTASNDISALAEQVKALDGDAINRRVAEVEKEVMSKLEDVQTESEAIVMKLASLEKDEALVEEERRKAFNKEKALLKRVCEVEGSLEEYQQSLDRVGRRVDEASIGTIKTQLEGLAKQVGREGSEMKRLEESIEVLEAANGELKGANERLAAEVAKLAARPHSAPAAQTMSKATTTKVVSRRDSQFPSEDDNTPRHPMKKSHKWAGGGTDRAVIGQGSNSAKKKPGAPPKKSLVTKAVPKAKEVTKPKQTAKTKDVMKPKEPTKSKEAAKPKAVAKPKHVATTKPVTKPSRKSLVFLDGEAEKPIVRAGKGWIEIAMSPSASEDESQEASVPVKRPRKQSRLDTVEQLGQDTQRLTRGGKQHLTQSKTVPQKRKAGTEGTGATQKYNASKAMKHTKAVQEEDERVGSKMEESNVIGSPPGSPQPPPAKRRRVIEQLDDGVMLQQFA